MSKSAIDNSPLLYTLGTMTRSFVRLRFFFEDVTIRSVAVSSSSIHIPSAFFSFIFIRLCSPFGQFFSSSAAIATHRSHKKKAFANKNINACELQISYLLAV